MTSTKLHNIQAKYTNNIYIQTKYTNNTTYTGSSCGKVDITLSSDSRGPIFKSSQWQQLPIYCYL